MEDLFAWLLSFFLNVALLFIVLYQLMCLLDLEADYKNPHDTAAQVNNVVRLEFTMQGSLCFLHLITRHWLTLLLCLPYVYYNVYLYTRGWHLVDVTEIFVQLPQEKKQRICKLAYLASFLFYSVLWMIYCVVVIE